MAHHDDTTKQTFLDALAKSGNISWSLTAAGIKSRVSVNRWREQDEEFSAAYDEALETAADSLEAAARTRAVEGVVRKRYDKDGNIIAEEVAYSDSLLALLLKANKPEKFAERTKTDLTSTDGSFKQDNGTQSAARIAALLDEARRRRDAGDELFQ